MLCLTIFSENIKICLVKSSCIAGYILSIYIMHWMMKCSMEHFLNICTHHAGHCEKGVMSPATVKSLNLWDGKKNERMITSSKSYSIKNESLELKMYLSEYKAS